MISGNGKVASFVATSGNIIQGNFIGTQCDGRNSLANLQGIGFVGVGNANNKLVGGTVPAPAMSSPGMLSKVWWGRPPRQGQRHPRQLDFRQRCTGNRLDFRGTDLNDPGDTDDGFNNLQNFPVISTIQGGFPSVTLTGSLTEAEHGFSA